MNLLFPYMLLQKHAIILCHLIAIKILKNKNKFECYQAGLESHHDQKAEDLTKDQLVQSSAMAKECYFSWHRIGLCECCSF